MENALKDFEQKPKCYSKIPWSLKNFEQAKEGFIRDFLLDI